MLKTFVPGTDNQRDFRNALGCFATGVTVVTAPSANGGVGMTANSFASVSLDPPLVLWSPAKNSLRYKEFTTSSHFAIHVLRAEQKAVSEAFASRSNAFDLAPMDLSPHGVPLLRDCLTRFECRLSAVHDGGDHAIVIGEVQEVRMDEGAPLVFLRGAYSSVS